MKKDLSGIIVTETCSANPDGIHGALKTMNLPASGGWKYSCKDVCEDCGQIVRIREYN